MLVRVVAGEVRYVALLELGPDPGVELGGLLLLGELLLDLGGRLLERDLLFFLYLRDLDNVEAELGLDGAHDVALLRVEGGLVELGDEASLRVAPKLAALLGAPRVLGVLAGELLEVAPVVELVLDLPGLLLLVRAEEYVPYTAPLGERKSGLLVLLVEPLDLLVGRPLAAHGILPDLLQQQARPDLLPEILLSVAELAQGLLKGLVGVQVLPGRLGLLGDLLLGLLDLRVDLFPRHLDVVLLGVGFGKVERYELRHDLGLGGLELRRSRLDLRGGLPAPRSLRGVQPLDSLDHLPFGYASAIKGHDLLRPRIHLRGRRRRRAPRQKKQRQNHETPDGSCSCGREIAQDDQNPNLFGYHGAKKTGASIAF